MGNKTEVLRARLQKAAPYIKYRQRKDIALKLGIHFNTVSHYLEGFGNNPERMYRILIECKKLANVPV